MEKPKNNKKKTDIIDGNNILYHYIQKTLLPDEELKVFTKQLIERLIIDLSIWFPPEVYEQIPILLPYVVRDAKCRRKKEGADKDEWGTADEKGFLRDDNSLIKGIIKSFRVKGKRVKDYSGKKLANGFVASHIWRELENQENLLASKFEKTNTFIPNLVWLPEQVSKLTDREGKDAQRLLQAISYKLYYKDDASEFKKAIWKELKEPEIEILQSFDINKLNYFDIDLTWIKKKRDNLIDEMENIIKKLDGDDSVKEVKCSKYFKTLKLKDENKQQFIVWLNENLIELKSSII
jgi:hypothetical protein